MTNQEVWKTALLQSSYDCGCGPEDFLKETNIIVPSVKNEKARVYLPLPLECDLVSYGNNIVAQVSPRTAEIVAEYINSYPAEHCFETPNLLVLEDRLRPLGLRVCFMAEYFLPDVNALKELPCGYEIRLLGPSDFAELYVPQWGNALCRDRKEKDLLAAGAYDGEKLIGLAGCSEDCADMYQIGVDVLPAYRRKGVASALTSRLALEILKLNKVPFYCAAWSNLKSVRNAVRCGFRPAWTELTARDTEFVAELNRI